MPKPTREQVVEAVYGKVVGTDLVDAVLDLIDAAWDGDIRDALNFLRDYGRHHSWCPTLHGVNVTCTCGFTYAWDAMEAQTAAPDTAQATPEPTLPPEPDDLERFNQEQRLRREGYATALGECGYIAMGQPRVRAASRYPLKKRVPKVVPDPFGAGEFTVARLDGPVARWRRGDLGMDWQGVPPSVWLTPERVHTLASLLADPYEVVDDVEPEEEGISGITRSGAVVGISEGVLHAYKPKEGA